MCRIVIILICWGCPLFQLNPDNEEDRALILKSLIHWLKTDAGKGLAGYSYTGAGSIYAALAKGNVGFDVLKYFLNGDLKLGQLASNTFYTEA